MSVGTTGGLLASAKATSVFKHEILRQYSTTFLAKVASRSEDNRVMVIDGFAGRGRHDDGTPGSAELFMRAAAALSGVRTAIRLFERNKSDAERLREVAGEYAAKGIDVTAECADINEVLETVVRTAGGMPLFLFLDPCGQNLPFDLIAKVLRDLRRGTWPPTEALLNLSADFTRRIGGTLEKGLDSAGIGTMNKVMGGDWWQALALSVHAESGGGDWEAAADAVAYEYTRRLAAAAEMGGVLIPVRRKPENQPTYHLAFLTRSPHGQWVMADALAKARQVWLRFVGPQADDTQDALFEVDPIGDMLTDEQDAAMRRARTRLKALAARERKFSLIDHVLDAYGEDYALLTESNLGKVMAELVREGTLTHDKGKRLGQRIYTHAG